MDTNFYPLKVQSVKPQTDQAVAITFDVPEDLQKTFDYIQGQYLTLRFDLNGEDVRRAYSLCSSPLTDEKLSIGVKRVQGGLVSNHLNGNIKAGDTIEVMPPQGRFYSTLQEDNQKDYFLFGGGSGITPLYSILKTVLEKEPKSRVFLYYGNRNEDTIMFKEELAALKQRYAGQLEVVHILSDPKVDYKGGFLGMFKKKIVHWQGEMGFLDNGKINGFIEKHKQSGREAEYFICGPTPMMEITESTLRAREIDDKHLHIEWFLSEADKAKMRENATAGKDGAQVTAILNGEEINFQLQGKETILEALRRLSKDPPFSCMSGACATCMAKLKEGEVDMEACFALDDDDVKEGFILTCTSRPKTDHVVLSYDEV